MEESVTSGGRKCHIGESLYITGYTEHSLMDLNPMNKPRGDIATRFKPKPDSLASKPISVFLPKELDQIVRALPNRSEWLRQVIAEAVQREQAEQAAIQIEQSNSSSK